MVSQNDILDVLIPRGAVKVDEIISALERRGHTPVRKRVFMALGKLIKREFVEAKLVKLDFQARVSEYAITTAGRAFRKSGKRIVSGPRDAALSARRKPNPKGRRSLLWGAFRMARKASLPELIELALDKNGRGKDPYANAYKYLDALVRARVASILPTRDAGAAPTSNGFNRYALIRDLGPLAPRAGRGGLYDFNSGRTLPYTDKATKGGAAS